MQYDYDVIVVGGGHAGCEAANAAAVLGSKVLIITLDLNSFAKMSCNPAMGGVAKGQMIREIDAIGGKSGIIADLSAIQFRMLNKSKGPAVWSPRTQNDRQLFTTYWRRTLEKNARIFFRQDLVIDIIIKNEKAIGVKTRMNNCIYAKAIILSNGTFLNGKIYIGDVSFNGGRIGDISSKGITEKLNKIGFEFGRMKTGTPVRIDGRSLNYSCFQVQQGDENPSKFSFSDKTKPLKKQKDCFITYTNEKVHEILKSGFKNSPLFNKTIIGKGPRYCPSIEDKIFRFTDRVRHQLFVEPEGWNTTEMYLNGFSSSLPENIQYEALKKIDGFENVVIISPGYAIEYDYFPPTQLKKTMETKKIENLFFAGQINGTTGYEEAAAQGLIAGINADLKIKNKKEFILSRSDAYIGVLIDDLVTKGTDEPYRMFTSRSEYKMLLRQDNADLRLTEIGYNLGLKNKKDIEKIKIKLGNVKRLKEFVTNESEEISNINKLLADNNSALIDQKIKFKTLLMRPKITIEKIAKHSTKLDNFLKNFNKECIDETEIQLKYESYIMKEKEIAEKINKLEKLKIPIDLNYIDIIPLSNEAKEKLNNIRPDNLGQAYRISGITPSDISVLIIYIEKTKK